MGLQKLGQPVPDSNLAREPNKGASQPTQVYVPTAWLFQNLPENGGSVAFIRVTLKAAGDNSLAHSRSDLTILCGPCMSRALSGFGRSPVAEGCCCGCGGC